MKTHEILSGREFSSSSVLSTAGALGGSQAYKIRIPKHRTHHPRSIGSPLQRCPRTLPLPRRTPASARPIAPCPCRTRSGTLFRSQPRICMRVCVPPADNQELTGARSARCARIRVASVTQRPPSQSCRRSASHTRRSRSTLTSYALSSTPRACTASLGVCAVYMHALARMHPCVLAGRRK